MRTNPAIARLAVIAVHTENLKVWREIPLDEHLIERLTAAWFPCLSSRISIVVNVINAEEGRLCFTATSTPVTTVRGKDNHT